MEVLSSGRTCEPGYGTFLGELVGGLLLAPRLGLDPFPDRDALAEELFWWARVARDDGGDDG